MSKVASCRLTSNGSLPHCHTDTPMEAVSAGGGIRSNAGFRSTPPGENATESATFSVNTGQKSPQTPGFRILIRT